MPPLRRLLDKTHRNTIQRGAHIAIRVTACAISYRISTRYIRGLFCILIARYRAFSAALRMFDLKTYQARQILALTFTVQMQRIVLSLNCDSIIFLFCVN